LKNKSELLQAIMDFIREAPSFPNEEILASRIGTLMADENAIIKHLDMIREVNHVNVL